MSCKSKTSLLFLFFFCVYSLVESEAWLADSAVFGADVCVKLAKVVVERVRIPSRSAGRTRFRTVHLYTGVILHIGTDIISSYRVDINM